MIKLTKLHGNYSIWINPDYIVSAVALIDMDRQFANICGSNLRVIEWDTQFLLVTETPEQIVELISNNR